MSIEDTIGTQRKTANKDKKETGDIMPVMNHVDIEKQKLQTDLKNEVIKFP